MVGGRCGKLEFRLLVLPRQYLSRCPVGDPQGCASRLDGLRVDKLGSFYSALVFEVGILFGFVGRKFVYFRYL